MSKLFLVGAVLTFAACGPDKGSGVLPTDLTEQWEDFVSRGADVFIATNITASTGLVRRDRFEPIGPCEDFNGDVVIGTALIDEILHVSADEVLAAGAEVRFVGGMQRDAERVIVASFQTDPLNIDDDGTVLVRTAVEAFGIDDTAESEDLLELVTDNDAYGAPQMSSGMVPGDWRDRFVSKRLSENEGDPCNN